MQWLAPTVADGPKETQAGASGDPRGFGEGGERARRQGGEMGDGEAGGGACGACRGRDTSVAPKAGECDVVGGGDA